MRNVKQPPKQPLKPHAKRNVWYAGSPVYVDNEIVARITKLVLFTHALIKHLRLKDLLGNTTQFTIAVLTHHIAYKVVSL